MNLVQLKGRVLRLLPNSTFARGVSVLAGGTAFSQLITISVLPLLTRLYSPDDFSVLAVYASILALITAISCLRFEIAIPIPKDDGKAVDLLVLSLLSVLFVTFLVSVLLVFFSGLVHQLTQDRLRGYLWLLPVGGMLSGLYAAFQYWATRKKSFSLISKTKIAQATSGASTQVGLGYLGLSPIGLLFGQLLHVGAGVYNLSMTYYKNNASINKKVSVGRLKSTFVEYKRFPQYSTFETLSNSASVQVPVLLIAFYAAGPEVGFLMLAVRLLSAPMSLIGGAVSQVYLSEAPAHYEHRELKTFTVKTLWYLVKLGALPLLISGVAAPFVVPIIFGDEWARAGFLISWMVPWFFMQFISSPISMSLHITGNQKTALMLQFFGLVFRAGLVLWAGVYFEKYVAEIYALTGFAFYSIYLLVVFVALSRLDKVGAKQASE